MIGARRSDSVGLCFPPKSSDCSGVRPEWFPFQIQVDACENDGPDPVELTARERSIGDAQPIPWWPFS
jgi:hypothetical protein